MIDSNRSRSASDSDLEREVGRAVRHVDEERHAAITGVVDESERPVGEHLRSVPLARPNLRGVGGHLAAVEVDELRGRLRLLPGKRQLAVAGGGRPLEAPLPRRRAVLLPEVPLAHDRGVVAGCSEHLGERHAPVVQSAVHALRLGLSAAVEMPHAGLMGIEPGEQCGPRRAAPRGVVKTCESQAAGRQRVDVRRGDLAAVAAEVAEPDVVHQDHHHVGSPRCLGWDWIVSRRHGA